MTRHRQFRYEAPYAYSLARESNEWGLPEVDLARPPTRFWSDGAPAPPIMVPHVDHRRAAAVQSPGEILSCGPERETWKSQSQRSVGRLLSWFLVCEDPQGRLQAQDVVTLAHQASLVQHVLQTPALNRVMIADEVGLGKTIEAGLVLRELLAQQPGLRVLYLAPARLVSNVRRELDRLGLAFRSWAAGAEGTATLADARVVASIHRAAHPNHFKAFVEGPAWDVIVVDECHHLSAWEPGGGNPVQKYKLVDKVRQRLSTSGRLILMSGTPHQGHSHRFRNLLDLLRGADETNQALAGRVIYRTKDDVCDWTGRPLFPRRQVNPAVILDIGKAHRDWLEDIHRLFEPQRFEGGPEQARRAAGWRAGQALQWASSSIHAGLGYLVRQAIRAGWAEGEPCLRGALEVLRPYRNGAKDEPVSALFARIRTEIGYQEEVGDLADIETQDEEYRWRPDAGMLRSVLDAGMALIGEAADQKWDLVSRQILDHVGDEKVVLFAQPIETVMALAGYLERTRGARPALIVGNQKDAERQMEIEAFWRPRGPQFLVSSRAGGEGINLQVARRLVHLDVPWNPMEMEQRVGRVHRFMSRRTIIVDTVVVRDSREVDAYRVARQKLTEISSALVPEDKFENLFSRVMALVPPEELLAVMAGPPSRALGSEDAQRVAALVADGFSRWREFDARYSAQRRSISNLDPGQATWEDLKRFVEQHLETTPAAGFSSLQFESVENDVRQVENIADVLEVEGRTYACGDYGGMPVTNEQGTSAEKLGVNASVVTEKLRELALPERPAGAAHLRWSAGPLPVSDVEKPFGLLVLARQSFRHADAGWLETAAKLRGWVLGGSDEPKSLTDAELAELVRGLVTSSVRLEPEVAPELVKAIVAAEDALGDAWRRPSESDREHRVVHAVTPVFAGIVA